MAVLAAAAGLVNRPDFLAAEVLLALAGRDHLWALAPVEHQGEASKLLGACLVLVLLSVVYRLSKPSRLLLAVLAFGAWTQLQAVLCVSAFILDPWPVASGQGMCSARIDFDLGALGLMALGALAWLATNDRGGQSR